MSRALVMGPCLLALGLSTVHAAGVTETELVVAFLARDAAAQRTALIEARREAAGLARLSAPAFRLEALREESTGTATAFTTDVLSFGVELELSRANATERRRAEIELSAEELELRASLVDAVTEFRGQVLATWAAQREVALLEAQHERTEVLLVELERLVSAGEQSRFDFERLAAVDVTHETRSRVASARARAESRRLALLTGVEVAAPVLQSESDWSEIAELRELVLASHPLLQLLRRRIEEGGLALELAGRTHPGRLDLRAGYRRDDAPGLDGGDGYELEAAYTLPGRSLRRRDEALALSEQGARALTLARAERRVAADFESSLARLEAFEHVHHPVTADLEAIRRGSLRRYRSGEAELDELIEVIEDMEEREALLLEAEVAQLEARLDLDRASGLVTAPELAELVKDLFPMKTTLVPRLALSTLLLAGGCQRPDLGGHSDGGHSHGDDPDHPHAADDEEDKTSFTLFTATHELFVELDIPVAGERGSHHAHVTRLADNAPATSGSFGVAFLPANAPDRVAQSYAVNDVARIGIFTPAGPAPERPGDYRLVYRYQSGEEVAEWDAGLLTVGRGTVTPDASREGEITFLKETSWFLPFRIRKPERRLLARSLTMPAHVEADPRLSASVAAPAAGRVLWSHGEEATRPGRRVEAGEVLGRLVPESSYASWNALDFELRRARIDRDRAVAELGRLQDLLEDGLVAEKRVLDARAEQDKADAVLRSARAERVASRGGAPAIELRATGSGIVTELLVAHGGRAEAGEPLANIASAEQVLVHGTLRGVTPDELGRVRFARARALDASREVDLIAAGARLLARPELMDARRAGLPVTWSVPNDGELILGELLELTIGIGEPQEQLTIPLSAVVEINTRPHAFVQVTGESFEQRVLELGTSDGERVAVLGGLAENDLVVTEGGFEVYVASLAGSVESHRH